MAHSDTHNSDTEAPTEEDLLKRFKEYLVEEGLKYTQPRGDILLSFFETSGHVSAEELHLKVRERNSSIGFATVHRTLKLLVDAGFAEEHRFGGRHRRYEPALKKDHHDHLICEDCGHIIEFEEPRIEALQDQVAKKHGFKVTDHRLELFGTCQVKQKKGVCPIEEERRSKRS